MEIIDEYFGFGIGYEYNAQLMNQYPTIAEILYKHFQNRPTIKSDYVIFKDGKETRNVVIGTEKISIEATDLNLQRFTDYVKSILNPFEDMLQNCKWEFMGCVNYAIFSQKEESNLQNKKKLIEKLPIDKKSDRLQFNLQFITDQSSRIIISYDGFIISYDWQILEPKTPFDKIKKTILDGRANFLSWIVNMDFELENAKD